MRTSLLIPWTVTLALAVAACDGIGPRPTYRTPWDGFTPVESLTHRDPGTQDHTLSQTRDSFTATTLPSGLVVLIGGTSAGEAVSGTEIYNDRTAGFSTSGPLLQARRHHAATLTPAGDIVVTGGIGQAGTPLISAEIWRAASGTFEIIQSMAVPRVGHTATLLPSGDVLVVGGITDSNTEFLTGSVEALDLGTRLWGEHTPIQATDSVGGIPRAMHTATRIPGPNGVAGDLDDLLVIVGGIVGDRTTTRIRNVTSSVLVFYPDESTRPPGSPILPGRWREMGVSGVTVPLARFGHAAEMIGSTASASQVLFAGGATGAMPTILGPFTATSAGVSFIEDSPGPNPILGVLDIDNSTLSPGLAPQGAIAQVAPITSPTRWAGGIGARMVFSPARLLAVYCGGNTYDSPPPARVSYSRDAFLIEMQRDPGTGYVTVVGAYETHGQMSEVRSWHAAARLPGPDGQLDTEDDTILVAGGEWSPSEETGTADEYTFP